VSVKGSAPR